MKRNFHVQISQRGARDNTLPRLYQIKAKHRQYNAIDEAIRTGQFVRNKSLRLWMDKRGVNKYDLNKYSAVVAKEFDFASRLNSTARQSSAERAWASISRFYDNCKKKVQGKRGYPKFKKHSRSVEYKKSGWKLDEITKKHITFTDKNNIGRVKLVGSRDIYYYQPEQIKRVRLVRRADGYYCQFSISIDIKEDMQPTGRAVGLDMGLQYFLSDSFGETEPNPRFYRKAERKLKRLNRQKSVKYKKNAKPQSKNYHKARKRYALAHLKISRQRFDHAVKLARCVCASNDCIVYEDLKVRNLVRNSKLAKSISDAGWTQFRSWLEYFGWKMGRITIAVPPHFTSQDCPNCNNRVKKSLSTRTHICSCGIPIIERDHASAIQILKKGLSTQGHCGTYAWGDLPSWSVGAILSSNGESMN
ncbi:transposase [Hyella patelloides LEGE 07179]|uniref:Transposase n=1 Tax=Hyella patelloides LEGE 07179 TaxID=945734 RepID=A0A563VUR2_9CYAN|nr:transposase [Hyella patelloides]VEP15206.1 transposase [Hyella patelloides LEGE 07179]